MERAAPRQDEATHLGSYQIIRKLARGGMAEVYLARALGKQGFEKLVVLKQILPRYAESQRYVQLFLDEARLAAGLNHANIVQVYDIGMEAGNYFFAMEYIHGQDVRTILHRAWRDGEKLPVKFAVQIAIQIGAALHYAHEKRRADGTLLGLVHRDISPSNVLVSYDGAIKLVDFGVAKSSTTTNKTRTGTLKGKIAYMSPEQAKGMPLDRRSDVFSLGIVLWEMVTTQRLFKGENDLQTLQLIIHQAPKKPTEYQPECSPALERIILKALAQDLTERYQTADELVADLEKLQADEGLGQSSAALGAYMAGLFHTEVVSWEGAKAQGVELAEHLTSAGELGDLTTPVSESEFIEAIDLDEAEEIFDDESSSEEDEAATLVPARASTAPPSLEAVRAAQSGPVTLPPGVSPPRMTAPVPLHTPLAVPIVAFPVAPSDAPWTVIPSAPPAASAASPTRFSQRMATIAKLYEDAPTVDPEVAVRVERRAVIIAACLFVGVLLLAVIAAIAA